MAVLVRPHGGPTWLDEDRFSPEVQSYVDAGLAVAMINYRGSTGYGAKWRDALIGDIGGPELEDLNAGLSDLVEAGIADPACAAVGGWSWGGYLTLMELGKHPELWLCGVAGIPVGDYALGYEDLSPNLQAYDRALLGGEPEDVPELMRDRSPIMFADQVRVPVLFLIGENDSRCPLRQAMAYVERLAARGPSARGVPLPDRARVVRRGGDDPPAAADPLLPLCPRAGRARTGRVTHSPLTA